MDYFSDNTMVKFVTFSGVERTYHARSYAFRYGQSRYRCTYDSYGKYIDVEDHVKYYDG